MIWEVLKVNGETERVTAESVFINGASTLLFLVKAATPPEPEAEPAPVKKAPFKKKWKPKAQTVTVRAFNVGAWLDVRLID